MNAIELIVALILGSFVAIPLFLLIAGFVKKHWKVIVIISMVVFYIAITGVTFVTED